ncbi:MAG: hypothetical protein FGM63_04555 [Candidatus Nanopelagicaceae bacterium]|nr:hypothetical protein [Candidatus Nanopelagicaceae bacterium]
MSIFPNKFFLANLAIVCVLISLSQNTSASQVTPPLTKCYIRVDNPHLSKSLKRLKGFDAVKVNAVSTCDRDLVNLKFTVEIKKKGFLRDYEIAERTIDFGGVIPANKRVAHKGTWVRCENSRASRYYGIAYAKGTIDGINVQTLPVITEKIVLLPCGT